MSGSQEVCEFELKLHGVTADDPKLEQGVRAITEGITSSHSGAVIRFSDPKLFELYIKDSGLPYSTTNKNGPTIYEVEVNFGPDGKVGIGDAKGILYTQMEACLSSMLLTPITLSTKGAAILDDSRDVASPVFPISWFTRKNIHLAPTTIIHQHLMDKKFYTQIEGNNQTEKLFKATNALRDFSKKLEYAEDYFIKHPNDKNAGKLFMQKVNNALDSLKKILDPTNSMSRAEFIGEIDTFVTIGTPPEQGIIIPLVHAGSGQDGATIEGMLNFLSKMQKDIKDGKITYNLLLFNCSHFLRDMLKASIQDNPKLKEAFEQNKISEEAMLGAIANIVSPHGGIRERLAPNALCTPVIFSRMLLVYREEIERIAKLHENAGPTVRRIDVLRPAEQQELPPRKRLRETEPENYHPNVNLQPIANAQLTLFTQDKQSMKHLLKNEPKIADLAKDVIVELKAQGQNATATQQGDGFLITDQNNQPIVSIEKRDDQIVIKFFDQPKEGLTATAMANAIHSLVNTNKKEKLVFEIESKEHAEQISSAINKAYQGADPNAISVQIERPASHSSGSGLSA